MTDAQFAALLGLATLVCTGAGKLAWSMFQAWLRERESDRTERKADRDADRIERREDRASSVLVVEKVTGAMVSLGERVSSLERVFDRHPERITGVHDVQPDPDERPAPAPTRSRTSPMGVRVATERPFDRER